MSNPTLLTMSPRSREALALKWFYKGFVCSGGGFNGESYDPERYPGMESLLLAEFLRLYRSAA